MMDEQQARLLQTLSQDPGAARTMLQSLLAERAAADPSMGLLMQVMASQEASPANAGEVTDRRERAQRRRERIEEMRAELIELRQRNDDLAAALGACPACWGRIDGCDECDGDGEPGWERPDPALFQELITPAVARRCHRPAQDNKPGRTP
jgi:hypothetical protein